MTPLVAATATPQLDGVLTLAALLWLGWYAITSARWPWKPCPSCGGRGRLRRLGAYLWAATTTKRDR